MLSLDSVDHIATKKHFHFSEAILEELSLLYLHLVSKEINLKHSLCKLLRLYESLRGMID